MQNENNNNQSKQIILTNGSIITPIELNGEDKVIRGQRRKVIEWYDMSLSMDIDHLDSILYEYVSGKLDSKGGK